MKFYFHGKATVLNVKRKQVIRVHAKAAKDRKEN